MKYHPQEIEPKWQKRWEEQQIYKVTENSSKPKFYVLDMFPYPSGAGLHVGHPLGYIASDILSRYKRLRGYEVLHPMGFDSFGLPAEQYAIQTGQHPAITTEKNIQRYKEQLRRLGFDYDWSREVQTHSPDYYKHTQWIFLKIFNSWYDKQLNKARPIEDLIAILETHGNLTLNAACEDNTPILSSSEWKQLQPTEKHKFLMHYRLAYLADAEVNWCPALGTVLANDEVVNGVSERGGHPVEKRKMKQWMMRITAYADRLLEGLHHIDWSEAIKESQRNWIGKSEGAEVRFKLEHTDHSITVFTTRPDTIFGVSFIALAPEHELLQQKLPEKFKQKVERYISEAKKRSERERLAEVKTISGEFTGWYAIHPFTGEKIPVWVADYVLGGYGTGAVMGVPAGDQRDWNFAKHFDIPIPAIFKDRNIQDGAYEEKKNCSYINSDFFNGLDYAEAFEKVMQALEQKGVGKRKTQYRLRDAIFARQRYWGEPIPVYYKNGIPHPLSEEALPLTLPNIDEYRPTSEGNPPLGRATIWAWDEQNQQVVENSQINHTTVFPLELNTMPGWAGSSWYFLRYMDPKNDKEFVSQVAENYWKTVDVYFGGSEHATGHLLYSRFWYKVLHDLGYVSEEEPFKKLINQGMITGVSAFTLRSVDGKYYSFNLIENQVENFQKIHVDIKFLKENSDELDIERLKAEDVNFSDADFVCDDEGKFITMREVEKMSKSKLNVINPDEICETYGADTLRLYEMFLGPLEQSKPWNTQGITGVHGFLKKLWRLFYKDDQWMVTENEPTTQSLKILHKTIKKVKEDIEHISFNTSVSAFMIAVNELSAIKCHERKILEPLLITLSPFAPHICEELWEKLGHTTSIFQEKFPDYKEEYLVEATKTYPVSFNGKVRFQLELPADSSKEEIEEQLQHHEKFSIYTQGQAPKKIIIVPGKIINVVI